MQFLEGLDNEFNGKNQFSVIFQNLDQEITLIFLIRHGRVYCIISCTARLIQPNREFYLAKAMG